MRSLLQFKTHLRRTWESLRPNIACCIQYIHIQT
jgi:hypothetical protein